MKARGEAGFTYIDVMAAGVILSVGILALLSAITSAIVQSKGQEQQITAKQIAASTLESVMSVKETDSANLGWDKVGNVGSNQNEAGVAQGIFLTGLQNVKTNAGADQIIGTADDSGATISGFQRQITITDVCDPDRRSYNCTPPGNFKVKIRAIEIKINYFVGSVQRQEKLNTILTSY